MIAEDRSNTHEGGVVQRLVAQGRERAVRVDEVDALADKDVTEVREEE